jgi:hypothetical protein
MGEPVFNRLFVADTCNAMLEGIGVRCPVGELDPVSRQHRMEAIGYGREQMTQALGGGRLRGAWMQRRRGQRRGAVDGHKEASLACCGTPFGDSQGEGSARVSPALLRLGRVSCHLR